jgi:hypothetical protein
MIDTNRVLDYVTTGSNHAWGHDVSLFFRSAVPRLHPTDDTGEEFATLQEAKAHANVVASELGRNSSEATVFVLGEDGKLLARSGGLFN